jgi:5-methyltetrahydrofolate--homocysteine methyltransferase
MVHLAKELQRLNYTIPLLIGGATTSKVASLLDKKQREEFDEEIKQEYIQVRERHYATVKNRKLVSLATARQKKPRIDWSSLSVSKPSLLGPKHFTEYPLDKLVDFIDWNPFFALWELRGKHPNRGYPKIFKDPTVGSEALKLFNEAQAMLKEILEKKLLTAQAAIGLFPANSVGDDIEVYEDESRSKKIATLFGLRQQVVNEINDTYLAYSDFIAPKESGVADYIGAFALTTGIGCEEKVKEFESRHDDYSSILFKALADRLAEAFAEHLHKEVRTTYWGYAAKEELSAADLHRVKYQGIRPAPGYPSQPDHQEKETIWSLLNVHQNTQITLTESFAMMPAASVCGLYFARPHAKYFAVGKLGKDQIDDYALRKNIDLQTAEKLLSSELAYA